MRKIIQHVPVRLLQSLLAGLLAFAATAVQAADSYDGKYLTIPKVLVGTTTYTNVVITVSSILSVGSGSPAAAYDSYNAANKQLSIPSVQYAGNTYTNVTITVGLIVSVGGSDGGNSGCAVVGGAKSSQINFGTSYLPFSATTSDNKYSFAGGTLTGTAGSSVVT
ncbi:MAG TPA: hypothetical protein VMH83_15285, partial [Candidatus Acidoferrum sp.]|nr:hypothetical protein [Candidatus Acidoferrum sp.]